MTRRRTTLALAAVAGASLAASVTMAVSGRWLGPSDGYRYVRVDPGAGRGEAQTRVLDRRGAVVATFTDGARSVVLRGPERTFREADTTRASVTTTAWVRLAPSPWRPGDERSAALRQWLDRELTDRSPDVLGVALQYQRNAAELRDGTGRKYGGGATYGPGQGTDRAENSDFNDYLGIDWTYPDGTVRRAKRDRRGALDCSGFVRIVYGFRLGYPLGWHDAGGPGLPRRAVMMATHGPGLTVVPDEGKVPEHTGMLQPGDLLFFDADENDGPDVDHVAILLGKDSAGQLRFISSRKTANGPTMGDVGGASHLGDKGLYAQALREAKRL